jgi:acetyl-CoA synthetase
LGVSVTDLPDVIAEMPTDQVLIEEMVEDGLAELLIGVTRDPAHGFVLTLGAGGVLTEILKDTVSLIVPAARHSIEAAFLDLKLAPVLRGYRGKPAANMTALVEAVMAVQGYVVDHADSLDEIEVNPLIATADRAVAVDALIRKADT